MSLPYKRTTKADAPKVKPVIIIKRARPAPRQASHGGAWKVAYADFVTAMMAFFLLLWLLSTSSKETLQGLSEYFTPVTGVSELRPIGINSAAPTAMNQKDAGINLSSPGVMQQQAGSTQSNPENPSPIEAEQEDNLFKQGAQAINQAIANDTQLAQYKDNVDVGMTPDGLRIELKDSETYPMFSAGSTELSEHGQLVLGRLVPLIRRMPNYMSVTGYTDASALESASIVRWKLSAGRAESALTYMVRMGLEGERPKRIIGAADSEILQSKDPRSAKNRRISILMMRGSHILIPDAAVPETARP